MRANAHCTSLGFGALAALMVSAAAPASVVIDGGVSWHGWTSYGTSDTLGVYGAGSVANRYEIFTTQFAFDSEAVTGSPAGSADLGSGEYSRGAFLNGNRMFGLGVRWISGADVRGGAETIVRFDLNGNSYAPASTVGGSDGRVSSTLYADRGDFNCQFFTADLSPTELVIFSGPGTWSSLAAGSVGGDFAFRGFYQASTRSYQLIFDLTAMPLLYTDVGGSALGSIGDGFRVSIRGAGNTDAVVVIPSQSTLALLGLAGFFGKRRRG